MIIGESPIWDPTVSPLIGMGIVSLWHLYLILRVRRG